MSAINNLSDLTSPRTHEHVQKIWDLASHDQQVLLVKILKNIADHPTEEKYKHINIEKVTPKLGPSVALLPDIGFQNDGKGSLVLSREVNRVDSTLKLLETRLGVHKDMKTKQAEALKKKQREEEQKQKEREELQRQEEERLRAKARRRPSYTPAPMPADSMVTKYWILQELEHSGAPGNKADPMATFWDARNWTPTRGEVVQLLQATLEEVIQQPNAVIKKKGLFAKLNESPGALDLLLGCGFVVSEHFISLPPGNDISTCKALKAELGRRALAEPAQPTMSINQQELTTRCGNLLQNFGEPHRVEWTVLGWSAKEASEAKQYEMHPALADGQGRKWKGYAKKFSKDRVGVFLQLVEGKAVPCVVTMKAFVLNRATKMPVSLPDAASKMTICSEYNEKEKRFGFPVFTTNVELEMSGAWNSDEDQVTFRLDFAVRDGPMTPSRHAVLPPVPALQPSKPKESSVRHPTPPKPKHHVTAVTEEPVETKRKHHEVTADKMALVDKLMKGGEEEPTGKDLVHKEQLPRRRSIPDSDLLEEMMNLGEKPSTIAGGAKPERFHKHERPVQFDKITQPEIAAQHAANPGVGPIVNQARGNLDKPHHHHKDPKVWDHVMSELPL